MVFSSLLFLFRFLPVVLVAYYVLPRQCRNFILFISSLYFYAWGEPVYVILILFSTLVDYVAGRAVAYLKEKGVQKKALAAVCCSATINLALLGFFKYGDFFLQNIERISGLQMPALDLALPIGISFYTFQTMSYTIDVYRGDAKVQKNFIAFGAYVALFPQLIAGPIIRYKTVAEQMDGRTESVELFYKGILRFMIGLGKKVLIANQIGILWDEVAGVQPEEMTVLMCWIGVVAFTFQIYFDFSGYSDMAIGLGYMFGFSFPENFDYPYESKSITEFWRRWHISLGTWFREYVYIPLGGNQKGVTRQMINIAIVWLLTGLWHGASWNFVLWGVYYGCLLGMEKLLWQPVIQKIPVFLRHLYTMLAVIIGWSIFSWQDMAHSVAYMKTMFFMGNASWVNDETMYLLLSHVEILVIAAIGSSSLPKKKIVEKILPENTMRNEVAGILFVIAIFIACISMLVNSSYNPFLYFRF